MSNPNEHFNYNFLQTTRDGPGGRGVLGEGQSVSVYGRNFTLTYAADDARQ